MAWRLPRGVLPEFFLENGLFYGEVGRDWGKAPRSLPREAVVRLAELGFVRTPKSRINFARSGLSPDRRALAELVETLFRLAYAAQSRFPLGVTAELHPVGHSPDSNPDHLGWTDAVPRGGPAPG